MRTQLKVAPLLALALVLATVLAGCSGKGSESDEDERDAVAPPAETGEGTGGIEGYVVDEEEVGIASAGVAITSLSLFTSTDAVGKFSFSLVEPGTYSIFANKIGYEQDGASVQVEAGLVNDEVMIILESKALPGVPYPVTISYNGFIDCGVGVWLVVMVVANCKDNPNYATSFDFEITPDVKTIIGELVWDQSTAAASQMEFDLWQNHRCDDDQAGDTTPGCNPQYEYAAVVGGNPLYIRVDAPLEGADPANETLLHWFVWTPGGPDAPAVLVTDQAFTVYQTLYYNDVAPDGYSARPE